MALMGKKSKNMASRMAKQAQAAPSPTLSMPYKEPEQPKRMSITAAANGGFIVRPSGGAKSEYNAPDEVYENLKGVEGCLEKHFGKGKKEESKGD